jgi:hypothetical protein
MATNRNDDNWYRQNRKTVGDKWAEGSDEESILHKVRDDGFKPDRDISTRYFGKEFTQSNAQWELPTWKPGPLKGPDIGGTSPNWASPKGYHDTHQTHGPYSDMTYDRGTAIKPGDNKYYKKMPGRAGNQRSGD